jgi:hypothetical protein
MRAAQHRFAIVGVARAVKVGVRIDQQTSLVKESNRLIGTGDRGIYDGQSEMGCKSVKVPVVVQENMPFPNAECSCQTVDGLSDRDPAASKVAIILGGSNGKIGADGVKYRESQQVLSERAEAGIAPHSLQYFG